MSEQSPFPVALLALVVLAFGMRYAAMERTTLGGNSGSGKAEASTPDQNLIPLLLKQKQLIEEVGARVLFLPPYSPDLNPTELMWSKVKNYLRGAEARTDEALLDSIGQALSRVTAKDAAHWFAHCGYSFI